MAPLNVVDKKALLSELASTAVGMNSDVGIDGVPPHHHAFLKLTSPSAPDDYAIISLGGAGWFQLEIPGPYYHLQADDLASDEDTMEYLEEYLQAATAYLDGRWSLGKSRFFRLPFVTIHLEDRPLKLGLSVGDTFRRLFRR